MLVLAGSRGMFGAAVLCGSAALRGGAGLVRVATPAELQAQVAVGNVCYMTLGLPDLEGALAPAALDVLLSLTRENDVLALGPGLGRSEAVRAIVGQLVRQVRQPLVLDADGLNALVGQLDTLAAAGASRILTPHPGEFARLVERSTAEVQRERAELAVAFAATHRVVLVLKGHGTLVTDGRRLYRNTTGNPGMATGGTGDVLTGVIAALVGQGLEPFAAAQLGVHVHGLAGDLAARELGEVSLIASDLLTYLPRAFQRCCGGRT